MSEPSSLAQSNELTGVEADVRQTLKPVAPPPSFRAHLRDGLMMAAQHQQAHRALGYARTTRYPARWLWLVMAALVGSLIGFVIVQLRLRLAR